MNNFQVIGQNCSLYRVHKVLIKKVSKLILTFIQWLKINNVPDLIINN